MKPLIPFFTFLFISVFSFAQFDYIDLSKYKLPDIKRYRLDFDFNLNNQIQDRTDNLNETNMSNTSNSDLKLSFDYFNNSRSQQSRRFIYFDNSWRLNNDKSNEKRVRRNRNLQNQFYLNFDERFYRNSDFFFHLKPVVELNRSNTLLKKWYNNDNTSFTEKTSFVFNPKLELGVGFGRIEDVGDFRHAIYIFDDLLKNSRLKRKPTELELIKFSNKITALKNKRFFDSRKRKIYELKSLDSLLTQMDLIETNDAQFYTSLDDFWSYGNEGREVGNRIQLDAIGNQLNDWRKSKQKDHYYQGETQEKTTFRSKAYGANISFYTAKPIKMKWQRVFFVSAKYQFNPGIEENGEEMIVNGSSHYFSINSSLNYRWYLNTRTNLLMQLDFIHHNENYTNEKIESIYNLKGNSVGLMFWLNYYISPQLRLSVYSNISNVNNNGYSVRTNSILHMNNTVSLNYAIF